MEATTLVQASASRASPKETDAWRAGPHIAALTWLDARSCGFTTLRLLPADVFALVARFEAEPAEGSRDGNKRPDLWVLPLRQQADQWHADGRSSFAVALLMPLGLMAALGVPLTGTVGERAPLSKFCGLFEQRRLANALLAADSPAERLALLSRWLEARVRLQPTPSKRQARVLACVSAMRSAAQGEWCIEELASSQAVTRRQLERDFQHCLGVAPAEYARLLRFQRAAAALASGGSIVDAALDLGFADQAHLSRQCRKMAGLTPSQLARDAGRADRRGLQAALGGRVMLAGDPSLVRLPASRPSAQAHVVVEYRRASA